MAPASPISFLNKLSPSALFELEEYDDALADICQPSCRDVTTSTAFSVDTATTAQTPTEHSSRSVGSTSASICSYDHYELKQLGCVGNGTYCRVGMVSHESSPEILAQKAIDPRRVRCGRDLRNAASELAQEAKMLSGLDHENIIKLRGVSAERFSESFVSGNGGYFLIMDILSETLRDRLDKAKKMGKPQPSQRDVKILRKTRRSISSHFRKRRSSQPGDECQKLYKRIEETVLGIAKGMNYLHSKNIVLRDLKPDNIGYENISDGTYDNDGVLLESTVKLFDFGMASKVDECDPKEICGSPRYMAPEIMCGNGYTLAVDVYSFGVILYEMCSLKTPFEETYRKTKRKMARRKQTRPKGRRGTLQEFYKAVVDNKLKPTDNLEEEVCCPKLRKLIEACWDHDPTKRPDFETILSTLLGIFIPDLFTDPSDSLYLDVLRGRDCTGRRSVSIEFECSFELDSCDGSTAKSYP